MSSPRRDYAGEPGSEQDHRRRLGHGIGERVDYPVDLDLALKRPTKTALTHRVRD